MYEQLSKNLPDPKFQFVFDAVGLANPSLYSHSQKYLDRRGIFLSTGPFNGSNPTGASTRDMWNIAKTVVNTLLPRVLGGVNRKYA